MFLTRLPHRGGRLRRNLEGLRAVSCLCPAGVFCSLSGYAATLNEVRHEGVPLLGEDRLRMKLNTLNRALSMPQAHEQAAGRARAGLQTLRERVCSHEQAVVATDSERSGDPLEEALGVVLDELFVSMNGLGLDQLRAEVFSDGLMPQADSEDGELSRRSSQARHRRTRTSRPSRPRPDQESSRLTGLDLGPAVTIRAQDFDLSPELQEELREVEGEGVAVVEDQNHCPKDAFRAPRCKVKAKNRGLRESCLAVARSWNKVPR